jgi:hypothetical protein
MIRKFCGLLALALLVVSTGTLACPADKAIDTKTDSGQPSKPKV